MKVITLQDINDLEPCYDPIKYLPKDWTGTLVDILDVSNCSVSDRIWVVIKLLDDKTNRLFAVWCAREALKLTDSPDSRSLEACNTAEKYAYGKATKKELSDAHDASYVVSYVAYAAYAAYAASYASACASAFSACAACAACVTACASAHAACAACAACATAYDAQITQLKLMIREWASSNLISDAHRGEHD